MMGVICIPPIKQENKSENGINENGNSIPMYQTPHEGNLIPENVICISKFTPNLYSILSNFDVDNFFLDPQDKINLFILVTSESIIEGIKFWSPYSRSL